MADHRGGKLAVEVAPSPDENPVQFFLRQHFFGICIEVGMGKKRILLQFGLDGLPSRVCNGGDLNGSGDPTERAHHGFAAKTISDETDFLHIVLPASYV